MRKPKITVIGSINMDLVTKTNTIPNVGETVTGEAFFTIPGGKGANQAIAAARLGADVTLIGCLGDDAFGSELKKHLKNQGIIVENILTVPSISTGVASITLSDGDNSIIVVSGANHFVTPEVVKHHEELIAKSDIVLLQLEIPLESVLEAVGLAKKHKVQVILNPAPIKKLPKNLVLQADYITPNEHEQGMLLATSVLSNEELNHVKEKCIVTKGSKGVMLYQEGEQHQIPSYKVDAVDSTGAGDSFNGALAFSLSKGESLKEACQFANAVAALSVTKLGDQSGMPTLKEVEEFINSQKNQ